MSATVLRCVHAAFAFTLLMGAGDVSAAAPVRIEIQKFAFVPGEITIAPGTTVIFTNHDETPHTVADGAKRFVSPALDTDDHYEHTFDKAGDVAYFCTVHPFMTGIIHVRSP
jgi:plastocyanin